MSITEAFEGIISRDTNSGSDIKKKTYIKLKSTLHYIRCEKNRNGIGDEKYLTLQYRLSTVQKPVI